MSAPVGEPKLSEVELDSVSQALPSASGSDDQRFLQEVMQWYREWIFANEPLLATSDISPSQILVVLFSQSPDVERSKVELLGKDDEEFLRGALDASVQGLMLATENLREIIRIRESFSSLNQALTLCCRHLSPSDTFVIIPLSQRRVLYHQKNDPLDEWKHQPSFIPVRSSVMQISAKQIDKDVSEFYDEGLRLSKSPISQMIWVGKKSPYKLIQSPERRIQSYLLYRLKYSYAHLSATVNEEHVGKGGRCDIHVEWPTPAGPYYSATTMLELKVLIEGRSNHLEWAHSGITQANDYRISNTEAVFACIFDARRDQSDQMPSLDVEAKALNVELRRYPMEAPLAATAGGTATASKATSKKGPAAKPGKPAGKAKKSAAKKTSKVAAKSVTKSAKPARGTKPTGAKKAR